MPVLKYLADTNAISDYFRPGNPVKDWFARHPGEIGISTLTLVEMRRGIKFVMEDYHEAIFAFDEAAALEWGRMMAQAGNTIPYDDSLIGAQL